MQLFRRKTRGVELTDAGETLLQASRDILARVQRAVEATQRTAQGQQGHVRVGAAPTAPFHPFVPRVIRAFREAFPGVMLTLEESFSNDLFQRLRDDQIDVAFYRSPPADGAGLKLEPLLREPMIMAVPKDDPLAKSIRRTGLSLRAFANETFIVYGRRSGTGLYDATIAACHEAGFSPRLGQEAPRIVSTLNLVAAGLGVAMVPAPVTPTYMKVDNVAVIARCAARSSRKPCWLSPRGEETLRGRQAVSQSRHSNGRTAALVERVGSDEQVRLAAA